MQTKKIFISRKLSPESPFRVLTRNNSFEIIDESLIKINRIRFSHTPKTDWIFFSSKNAIDHFFAQEPEFTDEVKFGVIGNASANHLSKYQYTADFIGKGVNLYEIAKEFRDILKDDSVLFPQAIDSYQTIQKQLSFSNTCYNLYVYKTSLKTDFEIPISDILVFTSPSNVIAYYNKYFVDPRQKVIAMGSTTKNKLNEFKVSNVLMPESFDENGLFKCLSQLPEMAFFKS
jgi:hydroxymethylbilane synthase